MRCSDSYYCNIKIEFFNDQAIAIDGINNYKSFFSIACSLEGLVDLQNFWHDENSKEFFEKNMLSYRKTGKFTFKVEHPVCYAVLLFILAAAAMWGVAHFLVPKY